MSTTPQELTPVVKRGDYYFKREDLFTPFDFCGVNGGKLRQCMMLAEKNKAIVEKGIITATSILSPQAAICSAVAHNMGVPCTIMYGGTTPERLLTLPYPRLAYELGAKLQIVARTGRTSAINAKALELSKNSGAYLVRYGFDMRENLDCFLQSVADQVQNLPDVDNIVITVGSAITIVGVLLGLTRYKKNVRKVYGVGVAPNREAKIKEYARLLRENGEEINTERLFYVDGFDLYKGFKYEDEMDIWYKGIHFHPRYEAKAFRWLYSSNLEGSSLFWITGGDFSPAHKTHIQ